MFQVENQISTYSPDGYMIVYAVDEQDSLDQAEIILNYLKNCGIVQEQAVILVANKTDLVRSRVVSGSGKPGSLEIRIVFKNPARSLIVTYERIAGFCRKKQLNGSLLKCVRRSKARKNT